MKKTILIFFLIIHILPASAQTDEPVKIGLLIQDKNNLAARQGSELAVQLANERGGLSGRPFQLIIKSMEGPWGTGSKQAIDLIFQDQVWALMGSHDGRNGHLVEQAATKSIVVFVSAWSSDPTLSQAFVPWFFNVVPTDLQQAAMLVDDIYTKRSISQIAVVSDQSYDSRQSLKGFFRIHDELSKNKPTSFIYEDYKGKPDVLADDIKRSGAGAIILFCQPANALRIIQLFKQKNLNQALYGSISILNEDILSIQDLSAFDQNILIPAGKWSDEKSRQFYASYLKFFKKKPGMVAFYAFDAMNLLIEAIKISGSSDREKIENAISVIQYEGVTGIIAFDKSGNRSYTSRVSAVQNGIPVNGLN